MSNIWVKIFIFNILLIGYDILFNTIEGNENMEEEEYEEEDRVEFDFNTSENQKFAELMNGEKNSKQEEIEEESIEMQNGENLLNNNEIEYKNILDEKNEEIMNEITEYEIKNI